MIRMPGERNERGIALLTVLLVGFALSAIALGGTMWILNAQMVQKNNERSAMLNDVAVAALEEGRSRITTTPALYPAFGHDTLDLNVTVTDASGATIPNVRRSIFVGPDGVTSGQYGVYGTVISVVRDTFGNQVVRRLQINQESFAKYAYFTTIEGNIVFANNDQIWGPVHSNDQIEIHSSGATFHNTVTTAASSIQGENNGTFNGGPPRKSVPAIPLPTTQAFTALQQRAANGGMSFAGNTLGNGSGEASIRMEFIAIDLNADGDSTDANEGFVRIFQSNNRPWYVTGQRTGLANGQDIRRSPNCGVPIRGAGVQLGQWTAATDATWNGAPPVRFRTVADTNPAGARNGAAQTMLTTNNAQWRCYLGGDPRLRQESWPNINAATAGNVIAWNAVVGPLPRPTTTVAAGGTEGWIQRPVAIGAPLTNPAFTARPDANFLWPINRTYNPSWEGVIYVNGRVAVSGVISGRVTLASPENIVIADDIRSAVDPGSPQASECATILGLFSGDSVVVSDNTLNTSQTVTGPGGWRTYDATSEEDIHAVVLALDVFGAERYDSGPDDFEDCSISNSGRGCLALNGGIIQRTRGAVGLTSGEGYIKRYTYNACAASDPPPYFPTTGKFAKNRIYELDPRNFDVAAWFAANQNN
ncbi:MAG TPA: hypothetical protein VG500_00295 [Gemmatimonadales bacterium]|nr:hypothetical protein [Gemmatimonadales bacterium]